MESRRTVITGMGVITPIGNSVAAYWESLLAGRTGVGPIQRFDPQGLPSTIAAECLDFDADDYLSQREQRRLDRFIQLAMAATMQALDDAALVVEENNPDRTGVIMGSAFGGMETLVDEYRVLEERGAKRVSPFLVTKMIVNMVAGQIAIKFQARGPNSVVVTACSSASDAIGTALRTIRRGEADVVITGGCDAVIVPLAVAGLAAARALSTRNDAPELASRPFDAGRDGMVMGEGAGVLILESLEHARRRGAPLRAELLGYGRSADAHHLTAPHPEALGEIQAMAAALDDARVDTDAVDYINAHATSTPVGDEVETLAIKRLFGERAYQLPVSSLKGHTGHLLGTTGATELVACVRALEEGVVPPTIHYETADPACDLDYVPNEARELPLETILSNSFGFGGQNACLVVGGLR